MEMFVNDCVLVPGQRIRPPSNMQIVPRLLHEFYGLEASSITELNSYDDRNYHVVCTDFNTNPHITSISHDGYVLKVVNWLDSLKEHVIEAQTEMLIFLNQRDINCPVPVKNIFGFYHSLVDINDHGTVRSYALRLLVYRPGQLLHQVPITDELLRNVGSFTAKLDSVLKSFSHFAYDEYKTMWMLIAVPRLRSFTYAVKNESDRYLAHQVIHAFENDVFPVIHLLEGGIIHGDLNEHNLVVKSNGKEIAAVIDFGDVHSTCLIFELAITLCYMILQADDVAVGKRVIEGYESVRKLTDLEKKILKVTVCARICQSLVMGAYSHQYDSQNEYLLATQKSGWSMLKKLWPLSEEMVFHNWGLF